MGMGTILWATGVTTCKERRDTLLPGTLDSLEKAGFPQPRLFVDGESDPSWYVSRFGYKPDNITCHYPALRTFGNWITALWELLIRNPLCHRYALFQDDILAVRNLRLYLECAPFPDGGQTICGQRRRGYLNLFTFPSYPPSRNSQLPPPHPGHRGWFPSNQLGKGALGLVFDRDGVIQLLGSENHIANRPIDPDRATIKVDGAIVDALKLKGYTEYVHWPSLVQHTGGVQSTLGSNYKHSNADSFPGTDFDAMMLLDPPQTTALTPTPTLSPEEQVEEAAILKAIADDRVRLSLATNAVEFDRLRKWLAIYDERLEALRNRKV